MWIGRQSLHLADSIDTLAKGGNDLFAFLFVWISGNVIFLRKFPTALEITWITRILCYCLLAEAGWSWWGLAPTDDVWWELTSSGHTSGHTDIVRRCEDENSPPLFFFLKHKFEIICKSKSRIELWEEDTNQNWKFHPSIIERVRLSAVWTS